MAKDQGERHDRRQGADGQGADDGAGGPSDLPVEMLREIASAFHLERTARVTAKALDESTLPPGLQRALADYRATYPGRSVKPLTVRTVVDGEPTVERGAEKLPRDEKLLTFSVTESVISSVEARVVGHVLFAQRG